MRNPKKILKVSLFLGGVYFLLLAVGYLIGLKTPMLFLYHDVAFSETSERLIAFFAFGWAMFFFSGAASDKELVSIMKYILLAGCGGIVGMAYVNIYTSYTALGFSEGIILFWVQAVLFIAYYIWLLVLFFETKQSDMYSDLTEYDTKVHSRKG